MARVLRSFCKCCSLLALHFLFLFCRASTLLEEHYFRWTACNFMMQHVFCGTVCHTSVSAFLWHNLPHSMSSGQDLAWHSHTTRQHAFLSCSGDRYTVLGDLSKGGLWLKK